MTEKIDIDFVYCLGVVCRFSKNIRILHFSKIYTWPVSFHFLMQKKVH